MKECCDVELTAADTDGFRRVLGVALAINAAMFVVEAAAGLWARSSSLEADALDFLGDSFNYAISLAVVGQALRWRAGAALVKGASMGLFGLWVIGHAAWRVLALGAPVTFIMGSVGALALVANIAVAALLYRHRGGDSNRRSVWLCSRNDAIGNLAVLAAAGGVYWSGTAWPDLAVAAAMAALGLGSAFGVIKQALGEWRGATSDAVASGHRPA